MVRNILYSCLVLGIACVCPVASPAFASCSPLALDLELDAREACTRIINDARASMAERIHAYRTRATTYESEESDKAIADLDAAIELDDKDASLFADRAALQTPTGAIEDLHSAIRLDPNNVEYYVKLAKEHRKNDDEAGEKKVLEWAAARFRGKFEPHVELFMFHMHYRRYSQAAAAADKITDKSEGVEYATEQLFKAWALNMDGSTEEALLLFNELEKAGAAGVLDFSDGEPNKILVFGGRGLAHFNLGKFKAAINDLTVAIPLGSVPVLLRLRGLAYMRMGKYEHAVADYTEAIAMRENSYDLYFLRADAYEKLGQKKKASSDRAFGAYGSAGILP